MAAEQHCENENSQSPDIDFVVVLLFLEDFGCHIIGGAAEGFGFFIGFARESEITDFGDHFLVFGLLLEKEDILWFDITMDDFFFVHVTESLNYIIYDIFTLLKWKNPIFLLVLNVCQISNVAVLHDHENPSIIFLDQCVPSNVRMSLTMLRCCRLSRSKIYCLRYRRRMGFFKKFFLFVHLTENS